MGELMSECERNHYESMSELADIGALHDYGNQQSTVVAGL